MAKHGSATRIPRMLSRSTEYYAVGDSLIGVSHAGTTNQLFTLRWNNLTYQLRALKNDCLVRTEISSLAGVSDTV